MSSDLLFLLDLTILYVYDLPFLTSLSVYDFLFLLDLTSLSVSGLLLCRFTQIGYILFAHHKCANYMPVNCMSWYFPNIHIDTHIKCRFALDFISGVIKILDLAVVIKVFHFFHWAILYHTSLKLKSKFFCRMLSSGFFSQKKGEAFHLHLATIDFGLLKWGKCPLNLEMDIISILKVCFWSVSA